MDFSKKTALVIDNGLFIEMAVMLSKTFGKVLYYSPWEGPYPKTNDMLVGSGVPGITRVDDFWSVLDSVDLFVFPDVGFGPLQAHLVSLGKRVWGSRMGEELELDRKFSKELCTELGIDIGPYEIVTGVTALRAYLKENDDQFVKISRTRGDMETLRAKNYRFIEPRLDELQHTLGAQKDRMEFVVEAAIPDAVEIGYDGFTIDGKFPKNAMWGVEVKDKAFVMSATTYDLLPKAIQEVNAKLAKWLASRQYRGFFSTEIRLKGNKAYLIDPCCRAGFPPSELYQIMIQNWAEIIWYGAEGMLVEPVFAAPWGAELLMSSQFAGSNWQEVQFPEAIRNNVKLKNLTVIDGRYYVVPQPAELFEVGAVVATGKTLDEACAATLKIADQVDGYMLHFEKSCLDDAHTEFDKATKDSMAKMDYREAAWFTHALRQRRVAG